MLFIKERIVRTEKTKKEREKEMKENNFTMNMESCVDAYSEGAFWTKVKNCALAIGKKGIEKALYLYYAWQDPDMPVWVKTIIVSALGYLICPLDAVPDMVPMVGYSDDAGVIAAALSMVRIYLKEVHHENARARIAEWFG